MSHTSTISSIVITDIHALKAAVKELKTLGVNCDLLESIKPRAYSSSQNGMNKAAPYVIKLHDADYDIGLYLTSDNKGLEARTDFYMGSVTKELGVNDKSVPSAQSKMGKLYQLYAVHAATRKANQQGFTVSRGVLKDGTIQLRVAA